MQSGGAHVAVVPAAVHGHHINKALSSPIKDLVHRPHSLSVPRNGLSFKFDFQFSNSAMEGDTKWDPVGWKALDDIKQIFGQPKHLDQQASAAPVISALEAELKQARARINELETERHSSKKKLEHFLKKLSEERSTWRSREHEKIRAIIDDIKADLSREKENRRRLKIVNSKLLNELGDAKLSAKRHVHEYEKERKARELIEEVCDELAKEIGEDKAEVEALKRESMKFQEEVEEERKMLQMAEVWREERVQMKLIDAKVVLEEKYSQMNMLIAELKSFLNSRSANPNTEGMKKAEFLLQAAASVNIQDIQGFTYEPPNLDDMFSVFENVNFGEANEREIKPCVPFSPANHASKIHTVSPEVNMFNEDYYANRHSNAYLDQSGELEEDTSEWETLSPLEDQDSSYSPDVSDHSINKDFRPSNVSRNGNERDENMGEETPVTEISEVCSMPTRHLKKASSISRLWRSFPTNGGDNYKIISVEGINERLSNVGLSNGATMSSDCGSVKDGLSPQDLAGQWSSPDSRNPHITRGTKGCIEWSRGAQESSLKTKLLEARMECQKIQLRQVLKQKI
ncbi:CAP-Gly domain-containing linker 1 [Olea europaea subsp. europaea]|uniref:CAP-Gly domain-containing linker 1 n=1 Tax=Olea europaea subsp. europaea TaxID=158383 RepID=A0A8S0UAL4_OLEEU|nr:CAP-Gly domain-containing linker 1 [Olea europaea subsp. europaea]